MEEKKIVIDISTKSIFKIFAFILFLFFFFIIRDVVAIFLISIIIVAAMSSLIEKLHNLKIPRGISILGIYLILFSVIGLLGSVIIPQVAYQIKEISKDIPQFIGKVNDIFGRIPQNEEIAKGIQETLKNTSENLLQSTTNIFWAIFKIFGGIVTFFIILVLVFYISVAEEGIKAFFKSLVPKVYEKKFHKIGEKIQKKIGNWVRGEAILMLAVGVLTFIGLKILGVKYALTLAVIAGILEIVVIIGPIISAIPAVIISFAQSPILALAVIILYIAIQQFENHILVPKIIEKTTGISPVIVVISLLIGAKLLGILGVILAVPVALILSVFVEELIFEKIEKIK